MKFFKNNFIKSLLLATGILFVSNNVLLASDDDFELDLSLIELEDSHDKKALPIVSFQPVEEDNHNSDTSDIDHQLALIDELGKKSAESVVSHHVKNPPVKHGGNHDHAEHSHQAPAHKQHADDHGHNNQLGHSAHSNEHSGHQGDPQLKTITRSDVIGQVRSELHDLQGERFERYLEYIAEKREEAEREARKKEVDYSENLYLAILTSELKEKLPKAYKEVIIDLAKLMERNGRKGKAIAYYEKYIEEFPKESFLNEDGQDNPSRPSSVRVYLKLARLYKALGLYKRSISKYYDVINSAIALPGDKKSDKNSYKRYRSFSLTAQFEIAETYLELGRSEANIPHEKNTQSPELSVTKKNLEEADRLLDRLLKLPLARDKYATAIYRSAYAKYLLGQYPEVIAMIKDFPMTYPENDLTPEAYYLSSITYKQMDKPQEAVQQVLSLLKESSSEAGRDPKAWTYWKVKTGNQLANNFYEDGDYFNALQIYQSLYYIDKTPSWQAQNLYQIGLCFERLGMFPKAIEAFEILVDWSEWPDNQSYNDNANLQLLRDMSQWRIENLQWARLSDIYMKKIQNP